MKKVQVKRGGVGFAKPKDLLKPFGFCCDVSHQDPDTRYNLRIPPFVTSLTTIAPKNKDGPDLKFRLQEIGKPVKSLDLRSGAHKVKSWTNLARGKRCRGPLRWYLEDEIALAREIVASEREEKCRREKKLKRELERAKKNKKRKRKKEIRKSISEKSEHEENEDHEKQVDKEEIQ